MKHILCAFALTVAFDSMVLGQVPQALQKHEMADSKKAEMRLYPAAEIQWKEGLLLTFMLFDYKIATTRAAASIAAVLFTGMVADKMFGGTRLPCEIDDDSQTLSARSYLLRFLRSCAQVALRLIPAIVLGVLVSMIIAEWLPATSFASSNAKFIAVIFVATFAVPLALPTFFEIPLAFVLLASGAPVGAALALLIAGPAINLPSLLTIMRTTSWKVAAVVAASIWAIAVVSGILANAL